METNNNLGEFKLGRKGDSAKVRLLHSSVETIESGAIHWVEQRDGKKKCVKCLDTNCPLCEAGNQRTPRVYIHLFDYTDNTEKVWSRTDKILKNFEDIYNNWGNLSQCVLQITRDSDDFPTYSVIPVNAAMYAPVNTELVDIKVAYRRYMTRSADELKQFLAEGIMPPHEKKQFIPKEQYMAQRNAQSNNQTNNNQSAYRPAQNNYSAPQQNVCVAPQQNAYSAPYHQNRVYAPTAPTAPQNTNIWGESSAFADDDPFLNSSDRV